MPHSQEQKKCLDKRGALHPAFLFLLAFIFTLLNSSKPLHIDDAAYYYYAAQISKQPLDPYGFTIFWYQHPEPADEILAPPLLPYWWALAIRLFGEHPFQWKLWLFPFSLLFVFALGFFFRRYAPGQEIPLIGMTVLSPTFLPAFNLMPDVPALSLMLSALVIFLAACDRDSPGLAALAGLLCSLAVEAKYTGFLASGVMLLYALIFGKLRLWGLAALVMVFLLAGWELFMTLRYGRSYFFYHFLHIHSHQPLVEQKAGLILPLFGMLGGLAPAVALVALAALRFPSWIVLAVGLLVFLGYAGLAYSGTAVVLRFSVPTPFGPLPVSSGRLGINHFAFNLIGGILCAAIATAGWRLCRLQCQSFWRFDEIKVHRAEKFLALWLVVEVLGYFTLSPFPAARRVMGIVIASTLLVGRLASETCRLSNQVRVLRGVACIGVLVGLLYWAVDLYEAKASEEAVNGALYYIRQHEEAPTVWYVGHWGFQYYAEKTGMRPVVPDQSRLRRNEWLVIPDIDRQRIMLEKDNVEQVSQLDLEDALLLRTVPYYYSGRTPMTHRSGPRFRVTIYRITEDFVPFTPQGVTDSHF